jgi:putative sterol carrier protein
LDAAGKVGLLVEAANRSASVGRMLRGWDRCVGLAIGPDRIQLLIDGGRASLHPQPADDVGLSFELDESTLDRLMAGALTPLEAKMQGLIRTSGSLFDVLRFAAILSGSVKEAARAGGAGGPLS